MDREIRMKGTGTVHFIDEYKRPRELKGVIIVDFGSVFQAVFVKVEIDFDQPPLGKREFLMPFTTIQYIEWNVIEP